MAIGTGTAVLGAAAIGGITSLLSGIIGSDAANSAATIQEKAALADVALQKEGLDYTKFVNERGRNDSLPWMESGRLALDQYHVELGLPPLTSARPTAGTVTSVPTTQTGGVMVQPAVTGTPSTTNTTTTTTPTTTTPTTTMPTTMFIGGVEYKGDNLTGWKPTGQKDPAYTDTLKGGGAAAAASPHGGIMIDPATQTGGIMVDPATQHGGVMVLPADQHGGVMVDPATQTGGVMVKPASGAGGAPAGAEGHGGVMVDEYRQPAQPLVAGDTSSVPANSKFRETPGYAFQVAEGEKGVRNNLAALGMKGSGAAMKALTRFRQGVADQTYDNYLTRLSNLATGGQQQTQSANALSLSGAGAVSQGLAGIGAAGNNAAAARASGYTGAANSWMNALSNFGNTGSTALGWFR